MPSFFEAPARAPLPLPILSRFRVVRPRFTIPQEKSLAWLVEAHVQSELTAARAGGARIDEARVSDRLSKVVQRCACNPKQIRTRGHEVPDCGHLEWGKMELYDVTRDPRGGDMGARTAAFERAATAMIARAYDDDPAPPADLVHVTCTGYVSPSPAQRIVTARGWGALTRVTHAYHMGCYAAVPAVRVACGFLAAAANAPALSSPADADRRVDVVHTELCSMHMDPSQHAPEALVVQSLFADGAVRYSASLDPAPPERGGVRVLAAREALLGSESSMRWVPSSHGMQMALARDVPEKIAGAISGFLRALYAQAGLDFASERGATQFAVHPGGPKILDRVRDVLEIDESQIAISRDVLRDHGNMSSATLPHIWARMIDDEGVGATTLIASLAFGPGLSVCGVLLRKETAGGR